ncbi:hypothetical protein KAZ66_06135 [Candidatus Woesebacteria bacterium]|nr:hypothetical protein [Candidatus Woesebacteria bacterium]
MKHVYIASGLLLLPAIVIFDMVIFFGGGAKVTCLSCDISDYFRTSSLSIFVIGQALTTWRK